MLKTLGPVIQLCNKCVLQNTVRGICLVPARHSQYNRHYQEPTVDKKELQQPLAVDDVRRFQPIKAATITQTTASYYDPTVEKFIRIVMRKGRKQLATYIVNRAFEHIKYIQLERYHKATTQFEKDNLELNPVAVFHKALNNCKPVLILQRVERLGIEYRVPVAVSPNYQIFKAMSWLVESAQDKDKTLRMYVRLAYEILDAHNNEGKSIRKKQETHRICEQNRAYGNFRR